MEKALYDSKEFTESLLAHLFRSPEVLELAKQLRMTGEDFLVSADTGVQHYKVLADIALSNSLPTVEVTMMLLKARFKEGQLSYIMADEVCRVVESIYKLTLHQEFMREHAPLFVKHRRQTRVMLEHGHDPDKLYHKLQAIGEDSTKLQLTQQVVSICPFEKLVRPLITQRIRTGIGHLDERMQGLAYGEYGILLGFSGAGKTAYSSNLARGLVTTGKKALYLSLEEPASNIADRIYANFFKVNYTALHNGDRMELEQKFNELDPVQRQLLGHNLRIEDLRALCPINTEVIKQYLEKLYKENNYHPDVVIIDQMEYMEPVALDSTEPRWAQLEKITHDCDKLSHSKIANQHPFSLWVQHQVNGKPKLNFSTPDIAGFKGVIKPADFVLGLGKENERSDCFRIFSLKVRHTAPFSVDLKGTLEHMTFLQKDCGVTRSDS